MEGDGLVNLGVDLPGVEVKTYGMIQYDMATKVTSLNLSGSMNFFYDKKAMEFMAEGINKSDGLSGIDIGRTSLEQAMIEEVNKEEAENLKAEYTLNGLIKKFPKQMDQMIYFTNMKLQWNDRAYGFTSKPISAIVALDGTPIMKDFTVRMAINFSEGGDRGMKLEYMVELPGGEKPGDYYFYRFEKVEEEYGIENSDK